MITDKQREVLNRKFADATPERVKKMRDVARANIVILNTPDLRSLLLADVRKTAPDMTVERLRRHLVATIEYCEERLNA